MLEAFLQGVVVLFQPTILLGICVAVLVGLVVGIIPGLSGLTACAILMPFVFQMPPALALSFLIALYAMSFTGGSITAILVNVPGTLTNAATTFDGFPMTQKGEAGRAIGAAVMSSMAGGALVVPLSLLAIPLLIPLIMLFKAPEMCFLVILGISFVATLTTGGNLIKGLMSGTLGVLAAMIGFEAMGAIPRFTFGSNFLYQGLGIVPVCLGLFALPLLIDMTLRGQVSISMIPSAGGLRDVFQGVNDVWIHKWLWLRCTLIGYIIGVIPGIGAETSIFVAYGHAKQISKNPEKFGTGCVEGVIAPESANNAVAAGALLTTIAFGIPGNSVMAIMLAAFMLVGIQPGPEMLIRHLPLCFTLFLGIALANIIGGVICLFAAPYLKKVASVHTDFLFPIILVTVFGGTFATTRDLRDIIVVMVFGLLSFFLKRFGYSPPALLLGFVLGGMLEYYFFISLKTVGPLFFTSPICLAIIVVIIALFNFDYLRRAFAWFKRVKEEG